MRRLLAAAMLAAVIALCGGRTGLAQAQTLRIALREDADLLDPTLARTYVGRIVFAGLCDKLFDIDEKLQHRAAACHRLRMGRPEDAGDPPAPGRAVPGRREAGRGCGEIHAGAAT